MGQKFGLTDIISRKQSHSNKLQHIFLWQVTTSLVYSTDIKQTTCSMDEDTGEGENTAPVVRDEYGFVVEEFIEQYEKFKKVNEVNQEKKLKKWKKILEDYHATRSVTKTAVETLRAGGDKAYNSGANTEDVGEKMVLKKKFRAVVAKGIPRECRAQAWWYFSGALKKQQIQENKRHKRNNSSTSTYSENTRYVSMTSLQSVWRVG